MLHGLKNNFYRRGTTLFELLIYVAIFSLVVGSIVGILFVILRIQGSSSSAREVSEQGRFVLQRIQREIRDSSLIDIPINATTSVLILRFKDSARDYVAFYASGTAIWVDEGTSVETPLGSNIYTIATTTSRVTSENVVVDPGSLVFRRIQNPPAKDAVQVDFSLSFNSTNQQSAFSKSFGTTIARVSAAVFDSDIVPSQDNAFSVGLSSPSRWKNVNISNLLNIGQLSADPAGGQNGSVYYNTASNVFRGYASGSWGDLGNQWGINGNDVYFTRGKVSVGTSTPLSSALFTVGTTTEVLRATASGTVFINPLRPSDPLYESWMMDDNPFVVTSKNDSNVAIIYNAVGDSAIMIISKRDKDSMVRFGDTGDADRGAIKYNNLTDVLSLRTNDVNDRLAIDGSGRISIGGDLTPDAMLEISNNTNPTFASLMISSSSAGDGNIFIVNSSGNVGIGTSTPTQKLVIASGTKDMVWIAPQGNVGIELRSGTTLGTPYIDFSNDYNTVDFDARLRLSTDDFMILEGAGLTVADGDLIVGGGGSNRNIRTSFTNTATINGVCHSGTTNSNVTAVDKYLVVCSGAASDIAEWYETNYDVEAGDIVATTERIFLYDGEGADPETGEIIPMGSQRVSVFKKAEIKDSLVGIISTAPVQRIGTDIKKTASHPKLLALVGRVPVKVSTENGEIKPGDRIAISSLPGYGAKAKNAGMTVGIALEYFGNSDGEAASLWSGQRVRTGKIMVLANLSWFDPAVR